MLVDHTDSVTAIVLGQLVEGGAVHDVVAAGGVAGVRHLHIPATGAGAQNAENRTLDSLGPAARIASGVEVHLVPEQRLRREALLGEGLGDDPDLFLPDEEKRNVEVPSVEKNELRQDVADLLQGRGPLLVVGLCTDAVGQVTHQRS